jgi:hypothetical protein
LANLASFLKVIKAVLLALVVVLLNLSPQLEGVFLEDLLLFLLNSALLLFNFLLFVNDPQEFITLLLGLLSQTLLSFEELPLPGILKVTEDLLLVLEVSSFLVTSLSLTLFECALGSKSVNLGLPVGSLLLEFSKASNFTLLLFLHPLELGSLFFFTKSFLAVIFNNLLFKIFLLLLALILDLNCALVGLFDFSHHFESAVLFMGKHLQLILLELISLSKHLLHFPFTHFLLLDALELSFFNLVDNNQRSLFLSLLTLYLALFLELERLQSLDFHHEIEAFLFFDPLLLESFGLIELSVTDCDDLRVQHHLVHVLNIIVVLVEHLLGLGEEAVCLFLVDNLLLSGWHLEGSFFV